MTENQPKTVSVPKAKRIPKTFLLFKDRKRPIAANIATNRKMMTVPIHKAPLLFIMFNISSEDVSKMENGYKLTSIIL